MTRICPGSQQCTKINWQRVYMLHMPPISSTASLSLDFVVFFCGVPIIWKSRLQPICATSLTEAEFYAAVMTAKVVKYLQYLLQELEARCTLITKLALSIDDQRMPAHTWCFDLNANTNNNAPFFLALCVEGNRWITCRFYALHNGPKMDSLADPHGQKHNVNQNYVPWESVHS